MIDVKKKLTDKDEIINKQKRKFVEVEYNRPLLPGIWIDIFLSFSSLYVCFISFYWKHGITATTRKKKVTKVIKETKEEESVQDMPASEEESASEPDDEEYKEESVDESESEDEMESDHEKPGPK